MSRKFCNRAPLRAGTTLDVLTESDENEECVPVLPGILWAIQRHLTAAAGLAAEELHGENVKYNFWSG